MPNVVVNADMKIGEFAIINTGSIIEYDCILRCVSHISYGGVIGSRVNDICMGDMGVTVNRNKHIFNSV